MPVPDEMTTNAGPGPEPGPTLDKNPWVRRCGKLTLDVALAGLAWCLASRLEPRDPAGSLPAFLALALTVDLAFGLTAQHYRLLDLREARSIFLGAIALVAAALALGYAPGLSGPEPSCKDTLLAASLLCAELWFLARLLVGAVHLRSAGAQAHPDERAIIVGAGRAGMRLCQEIQEHPRIRFNVVGFVDDAPEKQGVRIQGVPVLGPTDRLEEFIRTRRASMVVVGPARGAGIRVRELSKRVRDLGVKVRAVPGILDLVGDHPWKPDRGEISIEELLRREPVDLDPTQVRKVLEGTVAVITGAGGSIGSELARRVASFAPARLVLLGRGENSLWEIEGDLAHRFPGLPTEVALCDVRDAGRLRQVFQRWRPRAVFHAAAHKHVPYLERYPEEAVLNNILGTRNVLEAALAEGAGIFVNISTDKAVNPVNVLGVSKRIGELLVTHAAARAPRGAHYGSVRFGNVLGSRGSVIPLFREQIARGGPITVTHPDMARYFMTISEAVQLTLQAGVLGETAKVFALDMGQPVKILDLAYDLARLSGLQAGIDIDIAFTGPRPGEKLHEELFTDVEARKADIHAKVFEASQDRWDPDLLERGLAALAEAVALPEGTRQLRILAWFRKLVPAYVPSSHGLGKFLHGPSLAPRNQAVHS